MTLLAEIMEFEFVSELLPDSDVGNVWDSSLPSNSLTLERKQTNYLDLFNLYKLQYHSVTAAVSIRISSLTTSSILLDSIIFLKCSKNEPSLQKLFCGVGCAAAINNSALLLQVGGATDIIRSLKKLKVSFKTSV